MYNPTYHERLPFTGYLEFVLRSKCGLLRIQELIEFNSTTPLGINFSIQTPPLDFFEYVFWSPPSRPIKNQLFAPTNHPPGKPVSYNYSCNPSDYALSTFGADFTCLFSSRCPILRVSLFSSNYLSRCLYIMGQYNRATAYNSIEYISEIEEEQIKSLQYDEDDQWITASTKMNREIREILASVGRTMAQQTSYGGDILWWRDLNGGTHIVEGGDPCGH